MGSILCRQYFRHRSRASARKITPFVRKEDLPAEEHGLKIGAAQSLTAQLDDEYGNLMDEPCSNLREERKSTGFIRMEELPADSDSESDMEDHPSKKVEIVTPEIPSEKPSWNLRAERKLTGYVRKTDVPDDSDSDSEPEEV